MHIAFINPQGNFDPQDRYWTAHPDFGGQLVYVKEVALALGELGHKVDILTRRVIDAEWQGFEDALDAYPDASNVRIVRLRCGGEQFLPKEELWPFLGTEWVPNIIEFYAKAGAQPDAATSHYGDGGLAAAIWHSQGGPLFTFTGHSLGAQKIDRLLLDKRNDLRDLDAHYHFSQRIAAERVAMNHAARIITSTKQERFEQYGHDAYQGAVDSADDRKFAVVPPGVNLRIFDVDVDGPEDEKIAARIEEVLARDIAKERSGLPAIVCSSRLDPKKYHLGLVNAFAQSSAVQEAANLLLVVRGIEDIHSREGLKPQERAILDEIVAVADNYDLWGKISAFPLNSQHEIAAAYRYLSKRRSIFSLTAHYEPFGLAPLEAMAGGLPAVVTRNGGPAESMYDEETGKEYGVLVDPSDSADVAAGLLRLVGPSNEWDKFHKAGRERVLTRYTWEKTAAGYLDVIRNILKSNLPIPEYFLNPRPETELSVETIMKIWK